MATQAHLDAAAVDEFSPERQHELLDREARQSFNLTAEEFAQKWHAGEFRGDDDPKATQVAMLLPDAWTSPV